MTVLDRLMMLVSLYWCAERYAPVTRSGDVVLVGKPMKMKMSPPLEVYSDVHNAQTKQTTRLYVMNEAAADLQSSLLPQCDS